jgi:hypothetical protein
MPSDRDPASARDIERDMDHEAERMQRALDELDEHIEDAEKKASSNRERTGPGEETLDAVASDSADRTTSSDDPSSAVGSPADADEDA